MAQIIFTENASAPSAPAPGQISLYALNDDAIYTINSAGDINPIGVGPAGALLTATTTVSIGTATAPTAGQALIATSGTAATWQSIPSGANTSNDNCNFEFGQYAEVPPNPLSGGSGTLVLGSNLIGNDNSIGNNNILIGVGSNTYVVNNPADIIMIGGFPSISGTILIEQPRVIWIGDGGVYTGSAFNPSSDIINIGYASANTGGYGQTVQIGNYSTVSGIDAVAIGNGASATANDVAVGQGASANGTGVAVGYGAGAGPYAACVGASSNTAPYCSVLGCTSSISAENSIAIGYNNYAHYLSNNMIMIGNGLSSIGGNYSIGTNSIMIGNLSSIDFPGEINICNAASATVGDIQTANFPYYASTTASTQVELQVNVQSAPNTAPGSYIKLSPSCTYMVTMDLVAQTAGGSGDSAAWFVQFCIAQGSAGASATALVGSVTGISAPTWATAGALSDGWAVAVAADNVNGRPAIIVNGTAQNVSWVGNVRMTKVGF